MSQPDDATDVPVDEAADDQPCGYAVAHLAGAAALWLAHHGHDAIVAQVGRARVQAAFLATLAWPGVCVVPPDWDTDWGIGRVDLVNLLQAPLPAAAASATRRGAGRRRPGRAARTARGRRRRAPRRHGQRRSGAGAAPAGDVAGRDLTRRAGLLCCATTKASWCGSPCPIPPSRPRSPPRPSGPVRSPPSTPVEREPPTRGRCRRPPPPPWPGSAATSPAGSAQ